ncbi:hypothetical protein LCGC14_0372400 [marine sediment metagenome]|uniref:Uncharacterized protein n=1 Tax=marine sediment metagenome TaxID=412755 RepID=A0A0F9TAJ9_9ZZZZ
MGKKKTGSKTLESSTTESTSTEPIPDPNDAEPPKPAESPKPKSAPKFNGPTIILKDIDVKGGGVVSVTCLDNKVPVGKIQIIAIKAGDATYVYRRV